MINWQINYHSLRFQLIDDRRTQDITSMVIPVNRVRMSITPESRAAHTRCTAGQYYYCCTLSPPRFHQSAAYASRVFHRHTASPSAATGSRNPAPSPPGRSPASPGSAPARQGERRYHFSPQTAHVVHHRAPVNPDFLTAKIKARS